eukprot:6705958-Pyramimonas_sp.AAC.1
MPSIGFCVDKRTAQSSISRGVTETVTLGCGCQSLKTPGTSEVLLSPGNQLGSLAARLSARSCDYTQRPSA